MRLLRLFRGLSSRSPISIVAAASLFLASCDNPAAPPSFPLNRPPSPDFARETVTAGAGCAVVLYGPSGETRTFLQRIHFPKKEIPVGADLALYRYIGYDETGVRWAAGCVIPRSDAAIARVEKHLRVPLRARKGARGLLAAAPAESPKASAALALLPAGPMFSSSNDGCVEEAQDETGNGDGVNPCMLDPVVVPITPSDPPPPPATNPSDPYDPGNEGGGSGGGGSSGGGDLEDNDPDGMLAYAACMLVYTAGPAAALALVQVDAVAATRAWHEAIAGGDPTTIELARQKAEEADLEVVIAAEALTAAGVAGHRVCKYLIRLPGG